MPKKIQDCSRAHLISVPLPQHAASYTVITHQFVIDHSFQALANAGFVIVDEEYRCTADGQIAQGIYKLQYNNDPDLSMMFAWTNSYNKQVKFKCLIGAYINQTGTVMTSGDIGTWTRKHVGTADVETKTTIDDQVANAYMYYNQLVADKAIMTGVSLNKRKQAQLLGILFAEYQILTTEQASIIRNQMDRPSYVFENSNSLWAFYNYVTIALQHSHPRTWMEDQRILHYFISTVGNFNAPPQPAVVPEVEEEEETVVDPLDSNYGQPENQTNLLVQIAEITGDESLLAAQYPVTEEEAFQLSDTQVVQKGSDFDIDLHQSEEIILDANEAEEDHVIIDDEIWTTDEEPLKIATIVDETVKYTDPAGNTFETPIVVDDFISDEEEDMIMDQILIPIAPCAAHDTETEKDLEQEIRETEVANFFEEITPVPTLVPTPEEHAQFEAEEALYVEPEANLDLKESVAEVKEDNTSDFDFDFGSNDPEDTEVDNTPDFF
jgi:hypothetical protein